METPIIELKDIRKSFGPVEVLKGVDMQVYAGKVTALVGDNGAGKSTLIKGLSGAQPYDSGDVSFEGAPITLNSPKDASGHGIEVVYQDLSLCENLDIVQNMFLGREEVHQRMLDQAEMEKHATATLQGLSVRTMKSVRQKVSSLSGGQRQTVAIARAVLQKAKLVILDEPTAALGVAQTEQVLALVRRLADAGVGVIIISHNLADVFEVADYINVLYLGAMVAQLNDERDELQRRRRLHHRHQGRHVGCGGSGRRGGGLVTTPVEKSTNPPTNTAAQTVGDAPAPHQIATGHEGTVRDQIDSYVQRVRGGEMGMLPALAGVVIITVVFFILTPFFLTKTNIANLMTQTAALMMLAVALTFVILLAEIDLSAGVTGGLAMAIFILLTNVGGWDWIAALLVALVVGASIGTFIGFMVAKIGVPSFVITLALFLGLQGVILVLLGNAGAYRIEAPAVLAIMNKSMPVWAGWLMLAVIVGISLLTGLYDRSRRVASWYARSSDEPAVGTRRSMGSWRRIGRLHAEPEQVDERDPHQGRPGRRAHCARDPVDRYNHARPHPVRSPYLCGWRQPGSGQAGRHQRLPGAHYVLHPLLKPRCDLGSLHGQPGRHRRVLCRPRHRAVWCCRRSRRRCQPVWWPGAPGSGGGRRAAHLDDHEWARASRPIRGHHLGDHRRGSGSCRHG